MSDFTSSFRVQKCGIDWISRVPRVILKHSPGCQASDHNPAIPLRPVKTCHSIFIQEVWKCRSITVQILIVIKQQSILCPNIGCYSFRENPRIYQKYLFLSVYTSFDSIIKFTIISHIRINRSKVFISSSVLKAIERN